MLKLLNKHINKVYIGVTYEDEDESKDGVVHIKRILVHNMSHRETRSVVAASSKEELLEVTILPYSLDVFVVKHTCSIESLHFKVYTIFRDRCMMC